MDKFDLNNLTLINTPSKTVSLEIVAYECKVNCINSTIFEDFFSNKVDFYFDAFHFNPKVKTNFKNQIVVDYLNEYVTWYAANVKNYRIQHVNLIETREPVGRLNIF